MAAVSLGTVFYITYKYNNETFFDSSMLRRNLRDLAKEFKRADEEFQRTKSRADRKKLEEVAKELIQKKQACSRYYESNIGDEIENAARGLDCRQTVKLAKSILAKL